jgi:hypothetical protein
MTNWGSRPVEGFIISSERSMPPSARKVAVDGLKALTAPQRVVDV